MTTPDAHAPARPSAPHAAAWRVAATAWIGGIAHGPMEGTWAAALAGTPPERLGMDPLGAAIEVLVRARIGAMPEVAAVGILVALADADVVHGHLRLRLDRQPDGPAAIVLLRTLVALGMRPDEPLDDDGAGILHRTTDPEVARVALAIGADPAARDASGRVPAETLPAVHDLEGTRRHAIRERVLLDAGSPWWPPGGQETWMRYARDHRRTRVLAASWDLLLGRTPSDGIVPDAAERAWIAMGIATASPERIGDPLRLLAWLSKHDHDGSDRSARHG